MSNIKAHTRYSTQDGTRVPGVTTVVGQLGWDKNALIAWARREALAGNDPNKIRDTAANIGTLTHYIIECHIKGIEPDLSDYSKNDIDKAENGFLGFLDWEKDNKLEYIDSEIKVVSEKYKYGGTLDLIAKKNVSFWLVDFKTGKGIYPNHKIQVSAYAKAYTEQTGNNIKETYILHLNRETGAFAYHKLSKDDISNGWLVFKHCRELYELEKNFK